MNPLRAAKLLPILALCGLCNCKLNAPAEKSSAFIEPPPTASETIRPTNLKQHIRNNCASLLYDLLNDEKNLSKLLIVKRDSPELKQLVKTISATAAEGAKKLEELAQKDRTLDIHAMGLPSGEVATRDAISKTKTNELLRAKDRDFEFKLLLTQVEALSYGAHLAKVAAENEPVPGNTSEFYAISNELLRLFEQVRAMVRAKAN